MKTNKVKLSNSSILGPLIAAIVVALIVGFTTDRFWDFNNWNNLILSVSITALMAIGSTLVILTGGIDISPGAMIALLSMTLATFVKSMNVPLWTGVLIVIVCGGVLGAINGFLHAYLKIPAFIATLATASIFKGMAFLYNNGSPLFSINDNLEVLFYGKIFNVIPLPLIYVVTFYAIFIFFLKYSKLGREIYSVGGNKNASKLSGINVKKVVFVTFVIAGVMAGVAAVLMSARLNSGSPNYGAGMEMAAIAAAVIGGASLAGGRGKIVNTLLGALTIVIVQNGLNLHAIPTSLQNITLGAIIIAAVLLDVWKQEIGAAFKKIFTKN